MLAYVFENNGRPLFDDTMAVITLNYAGQTVDHIGNVVTITTENGFPNYGASQPRAIPQPSMLSQVSALIYFVASQVVINPQYPTTNPKFTRTPGCINRKIIDLLNQGRRGALQAINKIAILRQ